MDNPAKPGLSEEIAAALDWWRDAGVDADYHDEATQWLAVEEKAAPATRKPTLPREGGDIRQDRAASTDRDPHPRGGAVADAAVQQADWPTDIPSFHAWWLSEPRLDNGRLSGRVLPRGQAGAELMIIVPEPERDDTERLLSGPQGRLLDAMLAAMGVAPDAIYLASVLPRITPMADWAEVERGFAGLLRHHIGLVRPQRLLVLGANILPLLGHDPAHSPAVLRNINHDGLTIPLLAGKGLAALLERPRWKAGLWQGWLDWTRQV